MSILRQSSWCFLPLLLIVLSSLCRYDSRNVRWNLNWRWWQAGDSVLENVYSVDFTFVLDKGWVPVGCSLPPRSPSVLRFTDTLNGGYYRTGK